MQGIKKLPISMTAGRSMAVAFCIMAGVQSHARADWVSDILSSDILSTGLSTSLDVAPPGVLDAERVGRIGDLLTLTKAVPELVKRRQDSDLGLGTAFTEQAVITLGNWGPGKFLSTELIAPCFASGTCAVIGAGSAETAILSGALVVGAAYDAYVAGKIVEGLVAYGHEREQQIASEQYANILRERVNQQRLLKQLLQAQQNTPRWQDQRRLQLALQAGPSAPNTNSTGVSATIQPVTPPLVTKRDPIATSIGSPAQTRATGTASRPAPIQNPMTTAPSTPIGQSRPSGASIIIKVPGIVDGRPTMVDMAIPTNAPVNPGTSRSDGKLQSTATPAVTGTPAAVAGPVAVAIGTPVAIGTLTTIGTPIPLGTPIGASIPVARTQSVPAPTTSATPVTGQMAALSPSSSQSSAPTTFQAQGASTSTSLARAVTPGGISLSRAAADRMPLEITLDASALSNGKIVLSGRASKTQMDAALFLTALRAACDDRDPYFSLDPDNGALWSQQGDQASNEFWEKIKKDFPSDAPAHAKNTQPDINIRTVSATQDYAGIWHDISPHYPNFRSKLVFYPEWLRQTRLGEVLYKADVLLKELSSGVSILVPGKLRAAGIAGYLSADVEYAAKSLLAGTRDHADARPQWRGSRLWFDIAPSASPTSIMIDTAAPSSGDSRLQSLLTSNGFIRSNDPTIQDAAFVVHHGDVFDLSQVNPRMFVRVHDHATNKDLSDHDARLDGLATDVSSRFDQYAEYYDELRLLRDVFRAYIAARKITDANERLCGSLDAMPLLDSEKVATRLPDYHPSELFVTIGSYSTTSRKGRQTQSVRTSSMSGGVSISGHQFAETGTRDGETMITRAFETAIAGDLLDPSNLAGFDRMFIAFSVDDASGAPVRLVSNTSNPFSPRGLSDYPIENEPAPSAIPSAARIPTKGENDEMIGVVAALLIVGFAFHYLIRRRRGARG